LRPFRVVRHHQAVADDEATQLMLETLFVVRAKVSEIHAVVVGVDDDEGEDGEEEEEEDS
jgi:hypothetical protein